MKWKVTISYFFNHKGTLFSGQIIVGGQDGSNYLTSVELFPRPTSDTCSIPDLPEPRWFHTLSLLSGGRLVVCGGGVDSRLSRLGGFPAGVVDICISWIAGNTTWSPIYKMRLSMDNINAVNSYNTPYLSESQSNHCLVLF